MHTRFTRDMFYGVAHVRASVRVVMRCERRREPDYMPDRYTFQANLLSHFQFRSLALRTPMMVLRPVFTHRSCERTGNAVS